MIQSIIDSLAPYKGEILIGVGWFVHVFWPKIVSVYPWLKNNGGVLGVIKTFVLGDREATDAQQASNAINILKAAVPSTTPPAAVKESLTVQTPVPPQ